MSANPPNRKVMVIGVDGATLELIQPWVKAGLLPNFARLMQEGSWGDLTSIVPPMTPTAWNSFLTGTNPGKHGLYDFVGRREGSYQTWLTNSSYRKGDSIWRILSDAGYKTTVFNVPVTYPIEKVNGIFVSGLLTPADATDATHPRELLDEIKEAVPTFNFSPPGAYSKGEEMQFLQSIRDLNRDTLQTARFLLEKQEWDFYMAVFMGVDIVGHFMWEAMVEGAKADPAAQTPTDAAMTHAIRDCYREVDAAMGELIAAAGPDVHLIVMSDHGFGDLKQYIHVNSWLLERGFLKFKRTPITQAKRLMYRAGINPISVYTTLRRLGQGDRIRRTGRKQGKAAQTMLKKAFLSFDDVDWSRTKLYSFGFAGPIFVNQRGREPQGIVEPGAETERLLEQVIQELRALREPDTGLPLIGDIYRRPDIYWGGREHLAPDLVFMPRDLKNAGFGLFEFASTEWLTPVADRTGTHRMNGILFMRGPGIRQGVHLDDSSIMDIAPTVLALMGLPVPGYMDGEVLTKAMTPEFAASLNVVVTQQGEAEELDDDNADLDPEEERIMRERLQGLGYVA